MIGVKSCQALECVHHASKWILYNDKITDWAASESIPDWQAQADYIADYSALEYKSCFMQGLAALINTCAI